LLNDHDIPDTDIDVLAAFSGLYEKSQDPRVLPEGQQAHPVREHKISPAQGQSSTSTLDSHVPLTINTFQAGPVINVTPYPMLAAYQN